MKRVGFGIVPALITFADTGGEKPETYAYLDTINTWLRGVGFPEVTVVRYEGRHGRYSTLEENCLANHTLPSLAFGRKGCSQKFKTSPQNRYRARWAPARAAWKAGQRVVVAIGYDCGPTEGRRSTLASTKRYAYRYFLREWGWDRERCVEEIGLVVRALVGGEHGRFTGGADGTASRARVAIGYRTDRASSA